MLVHILKSKIHRAKVTGGNVQYEGSMTIDEDFMDKVGTMFMDMVLQVRDAYDEISAKQRSIERLDATIEKQDATIEKQAATIEKLEASLAEIKSTQNSGNQRLKAV